MLIWDDVRMIYLLFLSAESKKKNELLWNFFNEIMQPFLISQEQFKTEKNHNIFSSQINVQNYRTKRTWTSFYLVHSVKTMRKIAPNFQNINFIFWYLQFYTFFALFWNFKTKVTSVSVLKGEITHLYQCESSLIQQWNCVFTFLFESKVDISGTTSIKNTIGIFY